MFYGGLENLELGKSFGRWRRVRLKLWHIQTPFPSIPFYLLMGFIPTSFRLVNFFNAFFFSHSSKNENWKIWLWYPNSLGILNPTLHTPKYPTWTKIEGVGYLLDLSYSIIKKNNPKDNNIYYHISKTRKTEQLQNKTIRTDSRVPPSQTLSQPPNSPHLHRTSPKSCINPCRRSPWLVIKFATSLHPFFNSFSLFYPFSYMWMIEGFTASTINFEIRYSIPHPHI